MLDRFIEVETNNNENTVTNLLYGMMKNKYMRDAILRSLTVSAPIQLSANELDSIDYSMIKTQLSITDGGICDLSIESSSCFILIENKIRPLTPLQEYQTTTYPRMVANDKRKVRHLIFLLPDNYHINDEEISKRCEHNLGILPNGMLLFPKWSSVIQYLERQEITQDNTLANELISYIKSRLSLFSTNSFDRKDVITMMNPKLVHNAIEFYKKMKKFIEQADSRIREMDQRLLPCDWLTMDDDTGQLGKFFKTKNTSYAFWIGYDMRNTISNTNMFLEVSNSLIKKDTIIRDSNDDTAIWDDEDIGYRVNSDAEWVYFPINTTFLEEENWSANVQAFCDVVLENIKNHSLIDTM